MMLPYFTLRGWCVIACAACLGIVVVNLIL